MLPIAAVVGVVALLAGLANLILNGAVGGSRVIGATVSIAAPADGRTIPAGFVGLSVEYPAVEAYAGSDAAALDPVFLRLARQLAGGRSTVLRIGGDSADWTWWPVAGVQKPPGVTYTLNDRWLRVTRALAGALDAKLLLGLNLEAGSTRVAAGEAQALSAGLAPGSVTAFQLGNEPELYGSFAWYHTSSGRTVTGRPHNYGFTGFLDDFTRFAAALPGVPLSGPATGGTGWNRYLNQFLTAEPAVKLVTLHRYPLQLCFISRSSPRSPTISHLLASSASRGLADSFAQELATAHAHGLPLRIDELNTVACGADRKVSQTFASALWALDELFELVRVGVDGVNVHTFPGAGYELFRIDHKGGRWRASVAPMYYGLLMFAQAAPAGSTLLEVSGLRSTGSLKVWATSGTDGRVRIALINKNPSVDRLVTIRSSALSGTATLELLQAPGLDASGHVALAGQSFSNDTSTGVLQGSRQTTTVSPSRGAYTVTVPAASAALLTATARTSARS